MDNSTNLNFISEHLRVSLALGGSIFLGLPIAFYLLAGKFVRHDTSSKYSGILRATLNATLSVFLMMALYTGFAFREAAENYLGLVIIIPAAAITTLIMFIYDHLKAHTQQLHEQVVQISDMIQNTQAIVERRQKLDGALKPFCDVALDRFEQFQPVMGEAIRSTNCRRDHDLAIKFFETKFEELCKQIGDATFYVRFKRFQNNIWPELTSGVDYKSICDLSSYSRLALDFQNGHRKNYFEDLKDDWDDRLHGELKTLASRSRVPQKIIVYVPPGPFLPEAGEGDRPPCTRKEGKCDHASCVLETCIVKHVAKKWTDWAEERKHGTGSSPDMGRSGSGTVWLVSREYIQRHLKPLIRRPRDPAGGEAKLRSIDLGLFGDSFIGEEFKVPVELDDEKHDMEDYLYRFRCKKELVTEVGEMFSFVTQNAPPLA